MIDNSYYDEFINPTPDYQPANYWFWQRVPTKEEIEIQLRQMLDAGFHTFYIQARLAFPLEQYLSKEYLSAYRYAIEQAAKLGLKAGIYDDYNWNSGHAGGLTVKGHDEFRDRQLFWTSAEIEDTSMVLEVSDIKTLMGDTLGGPQGCWTYEGGVPKWGDWKVVSVVAYSPSHTLSTKDDFDDLSQYCNIQPDGIDACKISINLPNDALKGKRITAFVAGRCLTSRHINYLNKDATTRFIEVGYEPYKQAVGEFFGDTVFCMFMDHPHAGFYSWKQKEGNVKNSLMYDEGLHDVFQREHDYPVELAWLSFILPESSFTAKMRGDFFNTYGRLAREYFLGQISDWSHKNGLLFAGHELFSFLGVWGFFGGYHVVDQRTDFGGDYFAIGHYKDISTVDAYNSNPQIDAKFGDSIARADGKHGCFLEQYYFYPSKEFPGAIGHWNLTYEEMRAQAFRHTFLGTKQFIFHGFYLTDQAGKYELLSSSRFDFAPAVNYEPWFKHHHNFAQEIAHLSSFIYHAEPIADIGVLYPISTFQVEETDGVLGEESAVWHQKLTEYGLGFDIIEEQRLAFDKSKPGLITTGRNNYRILVLPGVKQLKDMAKVDAIVDFVRSGGKLILSGAVPSDTIEDLEPEIVNKQFAELLELKDNVIFCPKAEECIDKVMAFIRSALQDRPLFKIDAKQAGQIWSWTGKNGTSTLAAAFNDGDQRNRIEIQIPQTNLSIEKWDALTGKSTIWLWYSEEAGSTSVKADLEPGDIICLVIDSNKAESKTAHLESSPLKVLDASFKDGQTSIQIEGDRPGEFEIALSSAQKQRIVVPPLPEKIRLKSRWEFMTPSMNESTGISVMQGWETQGFENYSGEGIYSTQFDLEPAAADWADWDWKIVFPKIVSSAEIILNEQSIGFLSWAPYEMILPADLLKVKSNRLIVKIFNTGGNYYYAGSPYAVKKFPSGIIGEPCLSPVKIFKI